MSDLVFDPEKALLGDVEQTGTEYVANIYVDEKDPVDALHIDPMSGRYWFDNSGESGKIDFPGVILTFSTNKPYEDAMAELMMQRTR